MTDITEKVRKLIALAGGEGEEARTAAALACKLIREHGLEVVAKRVAAPRPAATASGGTYARPGGPGPSAARAWSPDLWVMWEERLRQQAEATRREAAKRHDVEEDTFTSVRDQRCIDCGAWIPALTPHHRRHNGAVHVDCDAAARVARGEPK